MQAGDTVSRSLTTRTQGLPKGLTLHGLRTSLWVHLAEAEASIRQMMDILGHDDIDHAELYSRDASQVRLAVQGMDRVVWLVTRKPLLGEPRGEPPYKALINNDNGRSEGHRFLREINTLADGSPIHSLRIPSYGQANLRTKRRTSFPCTRTKGSMNP